MKLTNEQLKQIIREELQGVLKEAAQPWIHADDQQKVWKRQNKIRNLLAPKLMNMVNQWGDLVNNHEDLNIALNDLGQYYEDLKLLFPPAGPNGNILKTIVQSIKGRGSLREDDKEALRQSLEAAREMIEELYNNPQEYLNTDPNNSDRELTEGKRKKIARRSRK
jgi:hypothetical protein